MGIEASIEGSIEKTQRNWAIAQAKYGSAPVYVDIYSHVHPYTPGVVIADQHTATIGAYHTSDVPYWFGTQDAFNLFRSTRVWTVYDRDLSLKMSKTLIAFANTGDPNTQDVHWPQWKPNDERLVDFGDSIRVEKMDTPRLNFMAVHRIGGAPARPAGTRDWQIGEPSIWTCGNFATRHCGHIFRNDSTLLPGQGIDDAQRCLPLVSQQQGWRSG